MNPFNPIYPFGSRLSLKPLIDFWIKPTGSQSPGYKALAETLGHRLAICPELSLPIENISILNNHKELLKDLMSAIFPTAFWESSTIAAMVPFTLQSVWVSPRFNRLLIDELGRLSGIESRWNNDIKKSQIRQAYKLILTECYGINAGENPSMIHKVKDPDTGLFKYFRLNCDFRFTTVHVKDTAFKTLGKDQKAAVLDKLNEPEKLKDVLPPEKFEFQGFVILDAVDVTESEVISQLSMDLIDKDSVMHQENFFLIEERLKILFQNRSVETGLAAIQGDQMFLLNHGQDTSQNCVFADSRHVPVSDFDGSVFEIRFLTDKIRLFPDFKKYPTPNWVDNEMLEEGVRSLIVAPLYHQNKPIGILKLTSPAPDAFGTREVLLTKQILPLFSMAIRGVLENINQEVERLIKVRCTAVHPAVEWRFRELAFDHLERTELGEGSEMEPVVFKDVYPLYGASDIRGSSESRNISIQKDLKEHLGLAFDVVKQVEIVKPRTILKFTSSHMASLIESVDKGIGTGEEISLIRFIRNEIEPEFHHFAQMGCQIANAVNRYHEALDSKIGTVYKSRKVFEDSVALLNTRFSEFLDQEEKYAQSLLPHYFSKHQTDGLDYVIYVGDSISRNSKFSMRHVSTLRLWQLIVACGMAWWTEKIKPANGALLETTHMILATHTPLSIRFRYDEKRFDVDQVYDIAHEIIWSRIGKAMVKGKNERLTQTGRIAVVYSRPQEAEEMNDHIEHLQEKGFLYNDVEWLELEKLQGIRGLKALRVGVNISSKSLAERISKQVV